MRWKVGIEGPPGILQQLAIAVSAHDIRIDAGPSEVILNGSRLDSLDDIGSVRREAERIVTILSGFARILLGSTESLHITDVTEAPACRSLITAAGALDERPLRSPGGGTSNDAPVEAAWTQSSLFKSLRMALSNPAMENALRLRDAAGPDWPELFRLYEVIEEGAGGKPGVARFSAASETAIEQLHHTVHRAATAGRTVRHDVQEDERSAHHLSLSDAGSLIDRLLMTWVCHTAHHQQPSCARH
jgi:hypothetical protein